MPQEKKATLRLRVTAAAEKSARRGHPWIFAESVVEQSRDGEPGELAVIYDRRDQFLAVCLFDPDSPIRARILHTGKPEKIDNAWLKDQLSASFHRREAMFDNATTGYRCVNGESDGLPGLVMDKYGATLAVKIYTTAWLPRLRELLEGLAAPAGKFERIVLRLSRNIAEAAQTRFGYQDGQILAGAPLNAPVVFLENRLRFESDPLHGQKTGFFLDQRENRMAVRQMSTGASVLNLFSFSGGFSLAAAAGGAKAAVSLDISAHALTAAQRNFALNLDNKEVAACEHRMIQADAFEWLQKAIDEKFDIAVVDPPSLARRETERAAALKGYAKLIAGAIARLAPRGILVACSCSAHVTREEFFQVARETARKSGRKFVETQTTGHAADHPATFRESEYLKAIYLRFT